VIEYLPGKLKALSSIPSIVGKIKGREEGKEEGRKERKEKKKKRSQTLVAQAYNPSYLGGRDWEDLGWRPARQIVCKTTSPNQNEQEV
jgi:hypothetical protein